MVGGRRGETPEERALRQQGLVEQWLRAPHPRRYDPAVSDRLNWLRFQWWLYEQRMARQRVMTRMRFYALLNHALARG